MAFLYFKNTTATGSWNDVTNWFEDDACTIAAANVPWVSGDSTYLGYDLTRSTDSVTAEDIIYVDAEIGNGYSITGTCDIATINSGTLDFTNYIHGGTWSGYGIINNSSTIFGGDFVGDNFYNSNGYIYGGTFTGSYFSNVGFIYGGNFEGYYFDNASGGYVYGGTISGGYWTAQNGSNIYGGTWSGEYGSPNTYIYGGIFTGNYLSNYGVIYGGIFSGDNLTNNNIIQGGIFASSGLLNYSSVYGGFWLESGFLDIDIFDYSNGSPSPTVTGQIRIDGVGANSYPFDLAVQQGFMTLKIKGQDVLGTGLL